MRFQAGETDVIGRLGARNFAVLEKDSGARASACTTWAPGSNTTSCSST